MMCSLPKRIPHWVAIKSWHSIYSSFFFFLVFLQGAMKVYKVGSNLVWLVMSDQSSEIRVRISQTKE